MNHCCALKGPMYCCMADRTAELDRTALLKRRGELIERIVALATDVPSDRVRAETAHMSTDSLVGILRDLSTGP